MTNAVLTCFYYYFPYNFQVENLTPEEIEGNYIRAVADWRRALSGAKRNRFQIVPYQQRGHL